MMLAIYIATIENCCVPMVVKHTLFATGGVVSLLLAALFNTILSTSVMSLLLGALFNTKLQLQNYT